MKRRTQHIFPKLLFFKHHPNPSYSFWPTHGIGPWAGPIKNLVNSWDWPMGWSNKNFFKKIKHRVLQIQAEFDGKYFPLNIEKRKEREFYILRQGPMTTVHYEARFRALERFALDLALTKRRSV